MDDLLDAAASAALVASGEAHAVELVEQAIRRIEAGDRAINAVVVPLFERALAEAARAEGAFRGVPYLLKDLAEAAGVPHSAGIAAVKRADLRPDRDAHFVSAMRAAGFALVGISNTSELGLLPTTEPVAWGPTRNPWSLEHSTGGSSGGSAAAVAAGMTPVAHASDGGGSARIPASACGVVGLKPTRGRVSTGPRVRYCDDVAGNSHEGILARSVRDVAHVLDAVEGHRPGDTYRAPPPARAFAREVGADPGALRVGVAAQDPSGRFAVDPQVRQVVLDVAAALDGLGHRVEAASPAALARGPMPQEFGACFPVIVARELERYGESIGRPLMEADVEPFTWAVAQGAARLSATDYAAGVDSLRRHAAAIQEWWEVDGWDLLLTPTLLRLPPRIGAFAEREREGAAFELAMELGAMTVAYNVTGQPAISLPLGMSEDARPIGVQLAAAYGRDDLLLRVAAQLEAALPWVRRAAAPLFLA